jgi:phage-related protein
MTVPVSDLQVIAPSAIIELFMLELNEKQHGINLTYRFHAGTNLVNNGQIVWAGNSYLRFPVEADGFEYSGNGQLPRPTLRVSNILGTVTAILLSLPDGLEGAKVTRIRTLARYLDTVNFPPAGLLLLETSDVILLENSDETELEISASTPDPTAEFPREIYFIDRKVVETRDVVEFELAAAFDLAGVRAPKRQCIANICQWEYKSPECSYTGGLPTCDKTLDACKAHFGANAQLPFGSFPGVGTFAA